MVRLSSFSAGLLSVLILIMFIGSASAQIKYHLDYEWAKIWINQDGSIDLLYNMSVTCESGEINYVRVGQPKTEFTIQEVRDLAGQPLTATNTGDGRVQVDLSSPITSGQTARFTVLTNVPQMIYEDSMNPGYYGMQFIPTWYDATIVDLRVLVVLPPGVTNQTVRTSEVWDNAFNETGRLAVYWGRKDLYPNQQYTFGVSFPQEFMPNYVPPTTPPSEPPPQPPPSGTPTFYTPWAAAFTVFVVVAVLIGVVAVVIRKSPYLIPSMSMETLGIRHGLTAVEASYILDIKPTKIVTEILYSLLQKRAIWVESTTPSLKLRIMEPFKDKTGTHEAPLRYYEIDFLNAIKKDGNLDEEKLAHSVMFLRDTVEEKMRGYCRRDTIDYYRKIVDKAWQQVEQAGTPDLASKAYDEQLLWLFLDSNYQSRTQLAFRDRPFEPNPMWLWYWYAYQYYHPNPTYKPSIESLPQRAPAPAAQPPATVTKPPTIPGADFANNIVKAVENTSNNIVGNLEKFANAIIPAPQTAAKASSEPARHGSTCVCACAACACVCACVSCACACAGGGVG